MMKMKTDKDIIILIVLIPLLLWGALFISTRMESQLPAYSVINKSGMGCSLFYEVLKELSYPVERTTEKINTREWGAVQIVAQWGGFDINGKEIKAWVEGGGNLVYLAAGDVPLLLYGTEREVRGTVTFYRYKAGRVIVADRAHITNRTLKKSSDNAYELLQAIDSLSYGKLYFNEAHMFSAAERPSLWRNTPMEVKFLLYQLLILVAAFFYFKGKRFGKPVPLYEEVERSENEYLYSAAALYRQAKCWDLMLDSYYRSFLRKIHCTHDNWLLYWERERLPNFKEAERVHEFMQPSPVKRGAKECLQAVISLERLRNILQKRREAHWRTFKKT